MSYDRHFIGGLVVYSGIYLVQNILLFALPLLAYDLSASGTGLALIKGAGFIPNILFAVFAGVMTDRIRKANAYRAYSGFAALLVLLLAVALARDAISIPGLVLFVILFNALVYSLGNALLALVRLTVVSARLSDATALSSGVTSVISTAGPALAGFALFSLGQVGLAWLCAALMIGIAGASLLVRPAETLPAPRPFWTSLGEGWTVFTRNRELVMMTVVIVLTNAAEGAFGTALILKLKLETGANEAQIGLVLGAAGIGAVIAARYAARLRRYLGYRTAFFWPIWFLALLYLAITLDWPLWALAGLSFCEGAASLFFAIGIWSYRQETTAVEHMGRVAGLTGAIFKIGMPPVIIAAGLLADTGSLTAVFVLAAGINFAAAFFLSYVAGWRWPRGRSAGFERG